MLTKLLIVALLVLGSQAGRPLPDPELKGIIDEAKELWHKLVDAIKGAYESATNKLTELLQKIENKANELLDTVEAEIQEAEDALLAELADIKEQAAELGIDISDCTKGHEDDLKNLGKTMINELVSCVTDKIQDATDIVEKAIDDVKSTYDNVLALGQEIDDCGSGFSSAWCISKIVAKMTAQLVELPDKITNDVENAIQLVESLEADLETCATGKAAQVSVEGAKIIAEIADCVANKEEMFLNLLKEEYLKTRAFRKPSLNAIKSS